MRLIDADPLREQLKKRIEETESILMCRSIETFMRLLDLTPTADVAPVRRAHWNITETTINEYCNCSLCGAQVMSDEAWNYCPNCGAKMDEGEEVKE